MVAAFDREAPPPALLGLAGAAALGLGGWLLALTPGATRLPAGGRVVLPAIVLIGWAFVGVGLAAWRRRPDNRMWTLLTACGVSVLSSGFSVADDALPYLLSAVADPLTVAIFIHLLLAFPSGALAGRGARIVTAAAYAAAVLPALATLLFDADLGDPGCDDCPANPLLASHVQAVADLAGPLQRVAASAIVALTVVLVLARRRRATPAERRADAPVFAAGAGILVVGALSAIAQDAGAGPDVTRAAQLLLVAAFATLPVALLAGLVRSRFFRTATVARLLERLGGEPGDAPLEVAHWLPDQQRYVDRDGRPFVLPPGADGTAVTEIERDGRRLGVLVHDAGLANDAQLLGAARGAAALVLENDRLEVELRARLEALRASRARLVEAGDTERRRLGRDLHDGAQQRLVSLLIELQLVRDRLPADPAAAQELVERALENARAAVEELRELAAGIHPAVLAQRGLEPALESIAARAALPVELDVVLEERLPAAVETAAYFLVAEALTNAAKHAGASHARVVVRREAGAAHVTVADDGAGGAALDGGSGLRGLEDRVGALDGTLTLRSPPGQGTTLRARFPLA